MQERDTKPGHSVILVLYLPPWPPSITYRSWADQSGGSSLLRRFVEQIVEHFGRNRFVIACQDENDCDLAREILTGLSVFITRCGGDLLIDALADLAALFPESHLEYFHIEAMFAPLELFDRLCATHLEDGNDLTYVADLPTLLSPEIAASALFAGLSRIQFRAAIPEPRDAVLKIAEIRKHSADAPQVGSIRAADTYQVPSLSKVTPLFTCEHAQRARAVLSGHSSVRGFEAVRDWPEAVFDPFQTPFPIKPLDHSATRMLYLSPGSVYSGAEECLRTLVQGLGSAGLRQVAVTGFEGLLAERLREVGSDVIAANWDFLANPTFGQSFAERVLDAVSPDWIHCNGDPGMHFIRESARRGIPIISHVRHVTFEGLDELHNTSRYLLAPSEYVKAQLLAAGREAEKIIVVPEGVNESVFTPGVFDKGSERRAFGLPEDAFIVLMIARLVPGKRHDLLLTAWPELQRMRPDAHLVFVGDVGNRTLLESLQAQEKSLGIARRVTWLPFQEDIRRIECASDVIVLCSDAEAFGICIAEAMSLEIPVVVSDSSGTAELVEHGVSGYMMRGGDASSLAHWLCVLAAADETQRVTMGNAGRDRVIEHYTLKRHADRVLELLQRGRDTTY